MEKCVLVVDDDAMNLRRTTLILEKHYDVLLAKSGEEALVDIDMPGMSGIETFRAMKDNEMDVPVIFLTASGYEDDVMTAIRLGAANYLKKPFMPKILLERIAKAFEKK